MPNMNKQWRAELRDLNRNKKIVLRDYEAYKKANQKFIKQCERKIDRAFKSSGKALERIAKREAILNGRLS